MRLAATVNYNQGNSVYRPLGASINLMPLSVWKKLRLPELISTCMTLELANRVICTPAGIARDVFVSVGKFTFPANFVIGYYGSDPRVPLILGRHFLRTARALTNVHDKEMILHLDSTKDLHPPLHVNPLSGSTTYSSSPNQLLEELTDEFALITFPSKYDDDLQFDDESDLKEIEFLLHQDIDSSLKDSIDQSILIQEKPFEIIIHVVQDKKLATSNASLMLEDFDPPFYEPLFFKEVPRTIS
nr:reverse transcriptase domain-containing protein [Tanacetum cinerariifolium]